MCVCVRSPVHIRVQATDESGVRHIRGVGAPSHLVHAVRAHSHDRRVGQSVEHRLQPHPVIGGLVLEDLHQTAFVHHLPHKIAHHCRRKRHGHGLH